MKHLIHHLCSVAALLLACGLAASTTAADVKLRERVAASSSIVRLGDVAEITASDRQESRQLAALPLMPAPAPNTERFLRKREIEDMLAAQGVKLGGIRFTGSEQVVVAAPIAAGSTIASESIRESAAQPLNRHAAILAGASGQHSAAKLDDARRSKLHDDVCRMISDYLDTKTGKIETRRIECSVPERQLAMLDRATTAPVCQGGSEPWFGRQTFTISFATADGNMQVQVYADVSGSPVPVVFATRPVARGNVITAADVEVRTVEPTAKITGQRTPLDSIDSLLGKEARQALQAGQVVFADQVQEPIVVKRGDLIAVTSQCGGIRVRTTARAKQDGARGDLVQVESLDTREPYDARVVGTREATVFSQARPTQPQPIETAQRYTTTLK